MLGLNALFVWTEFLPQYAPNASAWVYNGLESIRVPLTIVELIAIGVNYYIEYPFSSLDIFRYGSFGIMMLVFALNAP